MDGWMDGNQGSYLVHRVNPYGLPPFLFSSVCPLPVPVRRLALESGVNPVVLIATAHQHTKRNKQNKQQTLRYRVGYYFTMVHQPSYHHRKYHNIANKLIVAIMIAKLENRKNRLEKVDYRHGSLMMRMSRNRNSIMTRTTSTTRHSTRKAL
jgi:hypothetical protein